MISGLLILAGRLFCAIYGLFHIIPYEFDTRKKGFKVSQNIRDKIGFRAAILLNIFVLAMFVYGNVSRYYTDYETFKPKHILLGVLCIILLATSLIFNLNILFHLEEIPAVMVYAINLDKKLEKTFKGQPRPKLRTISGVDVVAWILFFLPGVFFFALIFGGLIGVTFGMRDQDSGLRRWIQSVFHEKADHPLTTFLIFWAVFGMGGIVVSPIIVYVLMGMQYIHMTNYWLKVMIDCPNKSLCFREGFIPLKLINLLTNQHAVYLTPWVLFIGVSLLSIMLYGSLKLYSVIGMPSYLLFPSLGITIFLIEAIGIPYAAEMDSLSTEFLDSCTFDRSNWARKMSKAFTPIRWTIGNYGYIDTSYNLTIFAKVIDNTINLLMTF